jgi:outer membrane receptor protein involved in Fe transport
MRLGMVRHFGRVCLLLAGCLTATFAFGQNANTGEIKGTVQDSTGAVVSGVTVTITNVDTGISVISATNSAGIYDAPSVPIGSYTISFAKTGFKEFVRKGVTMQIQTIAVDATLQVGEATEQVTVTAEVPLLQTETSDQYVNLPTKEVLNAPLVGGRWFDELTKVLPGVGGGGGRNASGGEGVAVNGTQANTANFLIDGTSATDPRDVNASNNYPPIDSIAEVSISTANGGAQTGNSLLALNVTLKSGTNRFHGSVYEFVQNDVFNSRNFFQTTGKKAPERWNQYGASIGGPIIKNKLFFFFNYQRNPVSASSLQTTTVPTDAMRNGDFTDPRLHATIYDKNSCAGNCARTPLDLGAGQNMIPVADFDPVAANILGFFPHPTDPTALTNNFQAVVSTPTMSQWYVAKVDYQISKSHLLSGSTFQYPQNLTFDANALCNLGFGCTRSTPNNRNQSHRITETWTVSPTIVNEFRIGAMREHDQYQPATFGKDFLAKIGIQPTYGSNAPINIFPNITVSGSSSGVTANTAIANGVVANLVENIYTASDVVTLIRGRHTLKIGGELDRQFQHDQGWGNYSSGDFTFNGIGTNSGTSPDPRNGGNTGAGIPFADFLLGDVGSWSIFNNVPTNIASWITSAYVNDDFKVTPRLTVNVGLRWQHQTGWAVAGNNFGNLDLNLPNPGSFPPGAPGAIRFGGRDGHNTVEPSVNAWSPRLGFAWSPTDKWSVRGSYGVFQVQRGTETYAHNNFPPTLGLGLNPNGFIGGGNATEPSGVAFQLQTGPPPNSVTFPTIETLSPAFNTFKQVPYYPTELPLQYFQNFLFSVQRALPANHLLDVSYVHNKGTHLNFIRDMNQVPEADLADPSNTGRFSPFRPITHYTSIYAHLFDGWSNYNALQLRLVKRTSYGVSYQFNYAWSKLMDTGTSGGHDQNTDTWQNAHDPRANYALATTDATHNFTGAISYELPFGAGRMYSTHGVDRIVGGWRVNAVIQARSGVPFTPIVADGNANNDDGVGGDLARSGSVDCFCSYNVRPNRSGSGRLSNPTIAKWFDTSAFTDPTNDGAVHAFGNSGRNILRGPRFVNVDVGIGKNFRITESTGLEVRADSYNFFNHPQFNTPDTNILSSTVGQITSTTNFGGPGRTFQMGARFSF